MDCCFWWSWSRLMRLKGAQRIWSRFNLCFVKVGGFAFAPSSFHFAKLTHFCLMNRHILFRVANEVKIIDEFTWIQESWQNCDSSNLSEPFGAENNTIDFTEYLRDYSTHHRIIMMMMCLKFFDLLLSHHVLCLLFKEIVTFRRKADGFNSNEVAQRIRRSNCIRCAHYLWVTGFFLVKLYESSTWKIWSSNLWRTFQRGSTD